MKQAAKNGQKEAAQSREFQAELDWVVSYPKSGNTWVRLVARHYSQGNPDLFGLGRTGDMQVKHHHDVSPVPLTHLGMAAEAQIRPAAMLALAMQTQGQKTLAKSHHACSVIDGIPLWQDRWMGKVVYVVRDPRDICCSGAEHFGLSHAEMAEMMATEDMTIGGAQRPLHHYLDRWDQHVEGWINARDQGQEVYVVRYENLLADDMEVFTNLFSWLLEEVDDAALEQAIKDCRFDRLQELETEQGFPEKSDEADRFFRKGQAGGWKDELSTDVARDLEEEFGETMEALEYL